MVQHLDAVSLSGLQAVQDGHSRWHCEGFARFLDVASSVVRHVAEDVQVAANQPVEDVQVVANQVGHSAVTHNLDTDDRKHSHRDGMDAHMEGCWRQCLELVVVTHGDRVLGDLPWLPVGGWCLQSLVYGYLYFF